MMSAFFHFQHTLNRLFNNCIKFYWYGISSSWNMKGGSPILTQILLKIREINLQKSAKICLNL